MRFSLLIVAMLLNMLKDVVYKSLALSFYPKDVLDKKFVDLKVMIL